MWDAISTRNGGPYKSLLQNASRPAIVGVHVLAKRMSVQT